jgi:transcription termination factor Rho
MRNTYDNKVPYKGNNQNQESKERETYNSVQPKQSFQKPQMSTAAGNEKMSKNILEILKRLGTKDEKFAITSLKATQKTLFSVVSQLISSLDGAFDESNLSV